jgi:TolB protein
MSSHWKPRFVLAFLIAASAVSAPPAQATFPGIPGKIVYQRELSVSNTDIYVATPGVLPATNITNTTGLDENPKWSPDGTKILFDSGRDGDYDIYTINPDGTGLNQITNDPSFDWQPDWSPDGTKIVFSSGRDGDPKGEIYTMNADGTGATRLTNDPNRDWEPAWSPDGTKIAWSSDRAVDVFGDHQWDVYAMNADGTGQTRLTTDPKIDAGPNWSPDGTKIAFSTSRQGQSDIWWMNADGTDQQIRVPTTSVDEFAPAFEPDSPDGTGGIIFARTVPPPVPDEPGGGCDIYKDSTTQYSRGSAAGQCDSNPDWQPVNNTYARPKGATPLRVPIVPAYKQCTSPSTTHRGAISSPSCYAPSPESSYLTVGTPDFNGAGANSIGSVLFRAKATAPENGLINVSLTDVRCQKTSTGCSGGALSDYSGSLLFETNFRVTDKNNGPTGVGPSANGTVTDMPMSFGVPCAVTSATTVGSTCSVSTSIDAVLGGTTAVDDGKRAIWELRGFSDGAGIFKLWDGGPDGNGQTTGDNSLYAVGGLFFP